MLSVNLISGEACTMVLSANFISHTQIVLSSELDKIQDPSAETPMDLIYPVCPSRGFMEALPVLASHTQTVL